MPIAQVEEGFQLFAQHVNPALYGYLEASGQNPRFVRSEGMTLYTADGKTIEDWMAFWGSQNFGHNNPKVRAAVSAAIAEGIPSLYSDSVNPYAGLFAKKILSTINPLVGSDYYETVFFTNSGTEAVECALKMSIASTKRRKILYCHGGYHGTTLGSLSIMAQGAFRDYLEPLLPEFIGIPYNHRQALENALSTGECAAFIMEPIQIEAGVINAEKDFVLLAQSLCKKFGTNYIIDEIQTGMFRTGSFTYFHALGAQPHIFLLGKSLAGGLIGAGACIAGKGIFSRAFPDYMSAELHFATFAGSPLACAGGLATFDLIKDPAFIKNKDALQKALHAAFNRIAEHPLIKSARLFGLMGGLSVNEVPTSFHWRDFGVDDEESVTTGAYLAKKLLERRIFSRLCAHDFNTLRVQPPLVTDPALCASFADRVLDALDEIKKEAL